MSNSNSDTRLQKQVPGSQTDPARIYNPLPLNISTQNIPTNPSGSVFSQNIQDKQAANTTPQVNATSESFPSPNTQTQAGPELIENKKESIQSPENPDSSVNNPERPGHVSQRRTTLIITAFVVIIGLCAFYWFIKYKEKPDFLPATPTDHSQAEQPDILTYKSMPVEDLFNEPTWNVGGQILNSGSSLKISGQPQANWFLVTSDDNSSWVDISRDFEISFYLTAGDISINGKNPHGRMRIYNNQEISLANSIYLTFSKEFSFFQLESKDIESGQWQSLGEGMLPEDGGLTIRFEGVNTGNPETISVLEKTSGNLLYSGQLSFVFFQTGDKLGFGFEIGNGVEHILIDSFRIDPLSAD